MALIGNRSVLHKSPGRFLSGTIASGERCNFGKAGMLAGRFETFDKLSAAIPGGHLSPSAWALPRTAGGMSAINQAGATLQAGPLNLAEGRNIGGDTTFAIVLDDAALQLVVSATGEAVFTFTQSGALAGALQAAGAATATFAVSAATLGAIIDAIAAASFSLTGSATPRATGALAGDITPFTELSPQNLAAAVWGALASAINDPGTAGAALLAAGSAGDPWGTPLPGAYAAGSAGALVGALINGLTTEQATQLLEIFQRLGLDPAAPMTTGTSSVTFDGKTIDISEAAGAVTLTRQP